MSDTPRTDANKKVMMDAGYGAVTNPAFSAQLERELNAKNGAIQSLESRLADVSTFSIQMSDMRSQVAATQAEVARLIKERDYVRAACAQLRSVLLDNHTWHQDSDEHDAYADSGLCEKNCAALAKHQSNFVPPTQTQP